jgi:hypothetical protein
MSDHILVKDLVVYAYHNDVPKPDSKVPDRKFAFTPEQFTYHYSPELSLPITVRASVSGEVTTTTALGAVHVQASYETSPSQLLEVLPDLVEQALTGSSQHPLGEHFFGSSDTEGTILRAQEAQTVTEVERHLAAELGRLTGRTPTVDLGGLDVSTAVQQAEAFLRAAHAFPELQFAGIGYGGAHYDYITPHASPHQVVNLPSDPGRDASSAPGLPTYDRQLAEPRYCHKCHT